MRWCISRNVFCVDSDKVVGNDSEDGKATQRIGKGVESLVRDHGASSATRRGDLFGRSKQTELTWIFYCKVSTIMRPTLVTRSGMPDCMYSASLSLSVY